MENVVRQIVAPEDLAMIVSNIGATPDFSAIYTTNSAQHTAFVQVSLKEDHKIGSYEYMSRVKERIARDLPELSAYFQSGGLVDAVLNLGLPAPIDVQVAGSNMEHAYATALKLAKPDPRHPRRRRRLHPAGHRLPRAPASTSTAPAPASSASNSAKSSTTSSPRSPPTR